MIAHAPHLILFVVAIGVAWIVGYAIGHVESELADRRFATALARSYGVSWRWHDSTAAIRRRIREATGTNHPSVSAMECALLNLTGVRSVQIATIATGRVAVTVRFAWWAKLLWGAGLLEDACQIAEDYRPVGTSVAVVTP